MANLPSPNIAQMHHGHFASYFSGNYSLLFHKAVFNLRNSYYLWSQGVGEILGMPVLCKQGVCVSIKDKKILVAGNWYEKVKFRIKVLLFSWNPFLVSSSSDFWTIWPGPRTHKTTAIASLQMLQRFWGIWGWSWWSLPGCNLKGQDFCPGGLPFFKKMNRQ